jgi:hypothetical protein
MEIQPPMPQLAPRAAAQRLRALPALAALAALVTLGCTENPTDISSSAPVQSGIAAKRSGRGKPAKLLALVVAPDSTVLEPAQRERFTASGRRADGTLVQVAVVWSASGGTIDSTGTYVAGASGGRYRVTARLVGGNLEDSSTVRITASAPTLEAVEISPASITLAAGAATQFSASGRMSDASTGPVEVSWAATGGTVDATGKYLAGAAAGPYRVIASAGAKADTAVVTITPLPPPPDTSPAPPVLIARGCPEGGYARLVTVSTSGQLASALTNAQPGDQIRIAAGTYSGAQSLNRSGTAGSRLVVCGMAGASPVLKGGQFSSTASYLTITGIVFEGAASVELVNPVYLHSAHHVTFTGNEIRGGHYHAGLSTDEVNHMVISYNYIHENGHDSSHDHGIYFKTTTGDGNVIADNVLVRNAARGISLHDNSGVGVFDVLVTQNTIAGNGSTGILVNDGDRITVVNNLSAFNGDATSQSQIRVLAGDNNRIWNNLTYSPTGSRAGVENTTTSPMSGNRTGNPLFINQYADLHVPAGSPAIGLGRSDFSTETDYDGKVRDSAPDAGAYEH